MTIHRAKGLEFPVVCVADLGRKSGGRRSPLLVGRDGTAGLRLAPLGGGDTIPTTAWDRLAAAEIAADAEEERRLFYVAMTRARELLILSGGTDVAQVAARRARAARRSTGSPARSSAGRRACSRDAAEADAGPTRGGARLGRVARRGSSRGSTRPRRSATSCPRRRSSRARAPAPPSHDGAARQARLRPARPGAGAAGPAAAQLLAAHRLREVRLPLLPASACSGCPTSRHRRLRSSLRSWPGSTRGRAARSSTARSRTSTSTHPAAAGDEVIRAFADDAGSRSPTPRSTRSGPSCTAFADSPLCERLDPRARRITREAVVRVRARARRLRPARPRHRRRATPTSPTARTWSSTTRPTASPRTRRPPSTSPATTRRSGSSTRSPRCGPARRAVEVAYCLLERPGRAGHDDATPPTDAPELADALAAARARRHRPRLSRSPTTPHRELCGDCPGRHALCSHPQSRDAQASAGSLAGSTGPS